MLSKLLAAWCLMAACVVIHAAGIASVIKSHYTDAPLVRRFRAWTWLFVRLAGWMILLHLIEISLWAAFYESDRRDARSDIGVVLQCGHGTRRLAMATSCCPEAWRLVGGIEALTGS